MDYKVGTKLVIEIVEGKGNSKDDCAKCFYCEVGLCMDCISEHREDKKDIYFKLVEVTE